MSLRKSTPIIMFKGKMKTLQPLYKYLNIHLLNLNRQLLCGKFIQKLTYKQHPKIIEN